MSQAEERRRAEPERIGESQRQCPRHVKRGGGQNARATVARAFCPVPKRFNGFPECLPKLRQRSRCLSLTDRWRLQTAGGVQASPPHCHLSHAPHDGFPPNP